MSTASVLIPADETDTADRPKYTLLLSDKPSLIEAAQRLRHHVFSTEPGFTLSASTDADRFDDYCDHLLVREDTSGEVIGCYRMLPPPAAIAAGGLYTATEFDISALHPLRASLVEMGRAVVHADHRSGSVVLLMWAGILAYLDRYGYDHVTGCVSVPVTAAASRPASRPVSRPVQASPGSQIRGVRDFVRHRHAAPSCYTVHPYRPVRIDGRGLDEIEPPVRAMVPPLMRGYLRLGAWVCGDPAHDPDFGVGDFPALLDKRRADTRYLRRLRSVSAATEMAGQFGGPDSAS